MPDLKGLEDEPTVYVEPLVRCRNREGLQKLIQCLKNPEFKEKYVLCEIGWYLTTQYERYWHPQIARLFESAIDLCARALQEPILCENDCDLNGDEASFAKASNRRQYRNCLQDDLDKFMQEHTQTNKSYGELIDGQKEMTCIPRAVSGAWMPCFCYDEVHWKLGEVLLEVTRIACSLERQHQDEVEHAEATRMLLQTTESEVSQTSESRKSSNPSQASTTPVSNEVKLGSTPGSVPVMNQINSIEKEPITSAPIVRQQLLDDDDMAIQQAMLDALNVDDDDDDNDTNDVEADLQLNAKDENGSDLTTNLDDGLSSKATGKALTSETSTMPVPDSSPLECDVHIALVIPAAILPGAVNLSSRSFRVSAIPKPSSEIKLDRDGLCEDILSELQDEAKDVSEQSEVCRPKNNNVALCDPQLYSCDILSQQPTYRERFEVSGFDDHFESNGDGEIHKASQFGQVADEQISSSGNDDVEDVKRAVLSTVVSVYQTTSSVPASESESQSEAHVVPSGWLPYYGGPILVDDHVTSSDEDKTSTDDDDFIARGINPMSISEVANEAMKKLKQVSTDCDFTGEIRVECPVVLAAGTIPSHSSCVINEAMYHADSLFLFLQNHLTGILTPDANDAAAFTRCEASSLSAKKRVMATLSKSEQAYDSVLLDHLNKIFGEPQKASIQSEVSPSPSDSSEEPLKLVSTTHSMSSSPTTSEQEGHPIPSHGSKCALRLCKWAQVLTLCSDWRLIALQEEIARGGSGNNHSSVVLASDVYKMYLKATKLSEYALAPYLLATPEPCPPSDHPQKQSTSQSPAKLPYTVPYVTPYRYAYRGFRPESMYQVGWKISESKSNSSFSSASNQSSSFSNFSAFSCHYEPGMTKGEFRTRLARLRPDLFPESQDAIVKVVPTKVATEVTSISSSACAHEDTLPIGENLALYWEERFAEHILRIHASTLDGLVATRLLCPGAASPSAYPNGYAAYFWNVPYLLHQFVSSLRRLVLRHPLPSLRPLVALMLSRSRYVAASAVRVLDDIVRLAAAFKGALRAYTGSSSISIVRTSPKDLTSDLASQNGLQDAVRENWIKAIEAGIAAKSQAEFARAIAAGQQQDALSWTRAVIESVPPHVSEAISVFAREQQLHCQQRGLQWDLTRAFIEAWDVCCNAVYFATGHRLPAMTHMDRRGRPFRRGRLNPYRFRLRSPQSSFRHTLKEANDMVSHATFLSLVIKQDPRQMFQNWEKVGQGAFGDVYRAVVADESALPPPVNFMQSTNTKRRPSKETSSALYNEQDGTSEAIGVLLKVTQKSNEAMSPEPKTSQENITSQVDVDIVAEIVEQDSIGFKIKDESADLSQEDEGVIFNPFEHDDESGYESEFTDASSYYAYSTNSSVNQDDKNDNQASPHSLVSSVVRSVASGAASFLSSAAEGFGIGQTPPSSPSHVRDHTRAHERISETNTSEASTIGQENVDIPPKVRTSTQRKRKSKAERRVGRAGQLDTEEQGIQLSSSTQALLNAWGATDGDIDLTKGLSLDLSGKQTNERVVAVKQVQIDGPESWGAGEKETLTLSACNHPNVVSYLGTYQSENSLWLVMDFCDGGTLAQFCYHNLLDEQSIAYICREVLSGLNFLHQRKRVHRDLKPANILLHLDGRVRIGDLGLLVEVDDGAPRSSLAGTENFMAPEMISGSGYDGKVDIWSLGCSLLEICNGKAPYKSLSTMSCLFRLATDPAPTLQRPGDWSPELRHFLSRCVEKDPHRRATASELLEHSFLSRAASQSSLASRFVRVFLKRTLKAAGLM